MPKPKLRKGPPRTVPTASPFIVLNVVLALALMGCIIADCVLMYHKSSKADKKTGFLLAKGGPKQHVPYFQNTHHWFGQVSWEQSDISNRPRAVENKCGGTGFQTCETMDTHDTGDSASDIRAAILLSRVHSRSAILLDYLKGQYDNDSIGDFPSGSGRDIRKSVARLLERHKGRLKLSEYHNSDPDDMVVAMNVNKGEELGVCVRDKRDTTKLNCINTMMRVVLHEFAHTMDQHYRPDEAHGPCFDRLADFLYMTGEGIDVLTDVHTPGRLQLEPLYHCPFSCDQTDDMGGGNPPSKLIPFCGLMLPRTHCPSDADPSPTTHLCSSDDDEPVESMPELIKRASSAIKSTYQEIRGSSPIGP
jgi:hypothetical protein